VTYALVIVVAILGVLILYALHKRADVRAEFSLRTLTFRLEAKDPPPSLQTISPNKLPPT
jgi:hypothetical protein